MFSYVNILGFYLNILAIVLPSLRISPLLLIRIAAIVSLYAVALSLSVIYIQSIGSGIGIFSGLFNNFLSVHYSAEEEIFSSLLLLSSLPLVKPRRRLTKADKEKFSNAVPQNFDEIMCGVMLGDGNLRMHGSNALLSIQQTHREIADKLWDICFSYNLVHTPVKELNRHDWKPVYYFKTFTMPYLTRLFTVWYTNIDGKCVKVIPSGIDKLLTPIALAHWIMGTGGLTVTGEEQVV